MNGAGGSALSDYLQTYLTLAQDGTEGAPGFWAVLWEQMRFPLAALLMGFTALGVIGLPVLFAVRGFYFLFRGLLLPLVRRGGADPGAVLVRAAGAAVGASPLRAGAQGMLGAYGLLRRVTGTAAIPSAMTPPTGSAARCAAGQSCCV